MFKPSPPPDLINLLEIHYAHLLRRGKTREALKEDMMRQVREYKTAEEAESFSEKILDAAEDLNRRLVY